MGINRLNTACMMKIFESEEEINKIQNEKTIKSMKDAKDKIELEDRENIKPGDIFCFVKKRGGGGHTGVIESVDKSGNIQTISYSRHDCYDYEGVGRKIFNINDEDKDYKFFRVR